MGFPLIKILAKTLAISCAFVLFAMPVKAEKVTADNDIVQGIINNMVVIPAGTFRMGDLEGVGERDELPVRDVTVSSFAISRYEVTFEQYDLFVRDTKGASPKDRWGRGTRPVIDVSWRDADSFIQWINAKTGLTFRLPSEAEWEYVARSGSSDRYSYGNDESLLCEHGNIADSVTTIGWRNKTCTDGYETTAPVGSFKPNTLGIYDMHGNVWEWMADCWKKSYRGVAKNGSPHLKGNCNNRTQRGGSWFYGSNENRVSYRTSGDVDESSVTVGFRLARDL